MLRPGAERRRSAMFSVPVERAVWEEPAGRDTHPFSNQSRARMEGSPGRETRAWSRCFSRTPILSDQGVPAELMGVLERGGLRIDGCPQAFLVSPIRAGPSDRRIHSAGSVETTMLRPGAVQPNLFLSATRASFEDTHPFPHQ